MIEIPVTEIYLAEGELEAYLDKQQTVYYLAAIPNVPLCEVAPLSEEDKLTWLEEFRKKLVGKNYIMRNGHHRFAAWWIAGYRRIPCTITK